MIVVIKNLTASDKTYTTNEIIIEAESQVTLSSLTDRESLQVLARDEQLLIDIASGDIQINDGTNDILGISNQYDWLKDNIFKRETDGRLIVHQTSRYLGLDTYFSSEGDDISDPSKVGNGEELDFDMNGKESETKYIDLNIMENETYLHEGYLQWLGARFDKISLAVTPTATPYEAGSNTNYAQAPGAPYLIVPAAGNGNIAINLADIKLVQVTLNEFGKRKALGFYNAEWDAENKKFINITPAPNGDGWYNIFIEEIEFKRFVNRQSMLGDGFMPLQTSDNSSLGQGIRIKVIAETTGDNHDWQCTASLVYHRKK